MLDYPPHKQDKTGSKITISEHTLQYSPPPYFFAIPAAYHRAPAIGEAFMLTITQSSICTIYCCETRLTLFNLIHLTDKCNVGLVCS